MALFPLSSMASQSRPPATPLQLEAWWQRFGLGVSPQTSSMIRRDSGLRLASWDRESDSRPHHAHVGLASYLCCAAWSSARSCTFRNDLSSPGRFSHLRLSVMTWIAHLNIG